MHDGPQQDDVGWPRLASFVPGSGKPCRWKRTGGVVARLRYRRCGGWVSLQSALSVEPQLWQHHGPALCVGVCAGSAAVHFTLIIWG